MKLAEIFNKVPDFRVSGKIEHKLSDILIISLCAVLSGADDFEEIEAYGQEKEAFLRDFLELPNGIPSHDTFNRVFRRLDKDKFDACLRTYSSEILDSLKDHQINIDGKVLRATGEKGKKNKALCLVSAWVSEHGLSLGQLKVSRKSNEKTAIPDLIGNIDISGALVSIDAMGCDKKIAALIKGSGGDYLLALKKNQKNLFEEVHDHMQSRKGLFDKHVETDYVGGRIETRTTYCSSDLRFIDGLSDWRGAKSIVMIECERVFKNGKQPPSFQTRFYISSTEQNAAFFGKATRHHWSIENQLHWQLDMVFNEDRQRVRSDNAPENMATLRKMALQLLLKHKGKNSLKKTRKKVAWNQGFLLDVLTNDTL
jgi:predicted transposase YbfD/YdcC